MIGDVFSYLTPDAGTLPESQEYCERYLRFNSIPDKEYGWFQHKDKTVRTSYSFGGNTLIITNWNSNVFRLCIEFTLLYNTQRMYECKTKITKEPFTHGHTYYDVLPLANLYILNLFKGKRVDFPFVNSSIDFNKLNLILDKYNMIIDHNMIIRPKDAQFIEIGKLKSNGGKLDSIHSSYVTFLPSIVYEPISETEKIPPNIIEEILREC